MARGIRNSMYWPPFGAMVTSGSTVTLTVRSANLRRNVSDKSGGMRWSAGGSLCPSSIPSSRRPPVALAKAMQSLAIAFQSAVLPVTARKDFWSRSCPSKLTRHLPLLDSFLFAPIARFFIGTSSSYPLIHFRELELPQPPYAVRGQTLALAPAVHGVLGHAQVLGDVLGGNPRFFAHVVGARIMRFKVVLNRLKSTI